MDPNSSNPQQNPEDNPSPQPQPIQTPENYTSDAPQTFSPTSIPSPISDETSSFSSPPASKGKGKIIIGVVLLFVIIAVSGAVVFMLSGQGQRNKTVISSNSLI